MEAQTFELKTPYLKTGRTRLDRAKTILSSRSLSKEVSGRCKHFVE